MSAAYLYHMIERHMPTMLIDEGDTFVRKNSDLTGIINSGHTRTGQILNVSSVAGHKVPAGGTVCAAIKHAVRALSEGLRRGSQSLWHPHTTLISPGAVATELSGNITDPDVAKAMKQMYESAIPPEPFARAVA
jgi:NADP-dependent 3-hydroxy acid dehydrogenase YdfG